MDEWLNESDIEAALFDGDGHSEDDIEDVLTGLEEDLESIKQELSELEETLCQIQLRLSSTLKQR